MGPTGLSMCRKHLKFIQISRIQVVQLELHPFLTTSHLGRFPRNWFQDDHLVEVAELLQPVLAKYDMFDESALKNKDLRQFSQDCLVGPTVRLGFTLKQKAEHQSLLTSSRTCSGRKSARVKDIKLIIYVCPRLHGSNNGINSAFSQLLNGEHRNDHVDISQYFHKTSEKPVNNYSAAKSDTQGTSLPSLTDSSHNTAMVSTDTADMSFSSSSHIASRTGGSSGKILAPPLPDISTSQSSSKTTVPAEHKSKTALKNLMTRRDQRKKSEQAKRPVKKSSHKKQASSAPACAESYLGDDGKNGMPDIRCSSEFSLKDPCSDRRMMAEISDSDESSQDELPDLNEKDSALSGHHKLNPKGSCPSKSGASADVSLEGSLCSSISPGDRCSLLSHTSPLSLSEKHQRKSVDIMKENCDELHDSAGSQVTNGKMPSLKMRQSNDEQQMGRSGNDCDKLPDIDNQIYVEKKNNVICTTDIPSVKSGKESTSSESPSSRAEQKRKQMSRSLLLAMQCDSNELPDIALPKETLSNDSDNQTRQKKITSSSKSTKFPFYYTSFVQQLEKSGSHNNGRNNLKKQQTKTTRPPSSPPKAGPLKSSSPTARSIIPPSVSSPSKTSTFSPTLRLIDVDFGFSSLETQKKKKIPKRQANVTRKVVVSSCFPSTSDLKDNKKNPTINGHCSSSASASLSCQSQQEHSDSSLLPKLSLSKRQQRGLCTPKSNSLSDIHQSLRSHKKRSHPQAFSPAKDTTPPVKKIKPTSPRKELEKADGTPVKKCSQKQSSAVSTKKSSKLKNSFACLSSSPSSPPSSPASLSRMIDEVRVTEHVTKVNKVSTSNCDRCRYSSLNLYLCTSPKDLSLYSPVPVPNPGLAATGCDHCSVIKEIACYPSLTETKCTVTRRGNHSETPPTKCRDTDVLQSTLQFGSNHLQAARGLCQLRQTSGDMAYTAEDILMTQNLTRREPSPGFSQKQHSPNPKVRITHCTHKRDAEDDRTTRMYLTGSSLDEESVDMTSVAERVSRTNRPKLLLTDTELEKKVLGMKEELMSVFNGTLYSERHELYMEGGISRSNLDHDSKLHLVKDGQEDVVMDVLMGIFGLKSTTMMDYMLRVLLHEAITRVYQQVTGHSY